MLSSTPSNSLVKTAMVFAIVHFPTTSIAQSRFDTAEACLIAVSDNDLERARGYATEILNWQQVYSPNLISAATECLESASELDWFFSRSAMSFVTGAEAVAARRFEDYADVLARLQCEAANLSIELNLLDKERERVAEARSLEALDAAISACYESYDADPIATLLNPVCSDIFSTSGLPDSQIDYPSERIAEVRRELDQAKARIQEYLHAPITSEAVDELENVTDCSALFED